VEKTNYFTVEVYGTHARRCAQYLRKGSRVMIDAEPDSREWTDQNGGKREAVTFRARQVVFEGARSASAATEDRDGAVTNRAVTEGEAVSDREPAGATAGSADAEGSATPDELPF
jgi:single-stranded DNA-binding protein